jgi:hypothetical protein
MRLAADGDRRTAGALNAERKLWERLDRIRVRILETHLRPYVSAVRKARAGGQRPIHDEHRLRVECAVAHLPANPLKDYGLARMVAESRTFLAESGLVPEEALTWLPDVTVYFKWLDR